MEVLIEVGAGRAARFPDGAYAGAGATITAAGGVYERADVARHPRRPANYSRSHRRSVSLCHVWRRVDAFADTPKEITDQMELARHGAHTFYGLLTRTAAIIAAHTFMRVCLALPVDQPT